MDLETSIPSKSSIVYLEVHASQHRRQGVPPRCNSPKKKKINKKIKEKEGYLSKVVYGVNFYN